LRVQETHNANYAQPPAKYIGEDVQVGSHLANPETLTGFPIFPAGTKSSVCRLLTRELYEELADVKDPYGFTF
jgi:hypothetical protein